MDKIYRTVVTEINPETGEEKELLNDNYKGLTILADVDDNKMGEIIFHDNLLGIAEKLAQGTKTRLAVRLANMILETKEEKVSNLENLMRDVIVGGLE